MVALGADLLPRAQGARMHGGAAKVELWPAIVPRTAETLRSRRTARPCTTKSIHSCGDASKTHRLHGSAAASGRMQ